VTAMRAPLPGERWHFSHGPIDLVIGAEGRADATRAAHEAAWQRFVSLLPELVAELPLLRAPVREHNPLAGPVARRMWKACHPFRGEFITPMAAVAGAVAQEIIACYQLPGVRRAWVNNGGDIALHLVGEESLRVGLCADVAHLHGNEHGLQADAAFAVQAAMPVRGVATSGWRGRSFSLGIADSVTVLARTASEADAAATVIANAVNLRDPRIRRRPACELKDDSDLGAIPVTVAVPPLEPALVQRAIDAGLARAHVLQAAGLVHDAAIVCQGRFASLGRPMRLPEPQFGSVFA